MFHRIRGASCLMASVVAALMCAHASGMVVLRQTYDGPPNTVGSFPAADWTFITGSAAASPNTVVQNGVPLTPTPPNVFQNEITSAAQYWIETSFAPFSLTATSNVLSYEFDLNVDEMDPNFSNGFRFFIYNNNSILPVGDYRILRPTAAATFAFYDNGPFPGIGAFAMDAWHHVKLVIDPSSNADGVAMLFVDNMIVPIHTESYSGQFTPTNRTSNMQKFDIITQNNQLSRIYIDNLVIATPEPTGLAAVFGLAGAALLRRRRCVG